MSILSSIFLGLVQGVSEFLPISSSGHLSLFQHFFGLATTDGSLFFDVLLHLGTLIAIFVYYWKDIVKLLKALVHLVQRLVSKEKRQSGQRLTPSERMVVMIIVATLPLFVILPIKDQVESLYSNTIFVGCALLVTGLLLFFSDRMARGKKGAKSATLLDALLVGVGQAVAVVPGGDHHLRRHDAGVPPEVFRAVLLPAVHPRGAGGQHPHHRGCRPAGD